MFILEGWWLASWQFWELPLLGMSGISSNVARLGIPDRLSAGSLNTVDLAAELDCDPGAVSSLLRAAASIDKIPH